MYFPSEHARTPVVLRDSSHWSGCHLPPAGECPEYCATSFYIDVKIAKPYPCPRPPQVSWFAAWLALDERRIAAGRDGVLPCLVHRDHAPRPASGGRGARAKLLYTRLLASPLYKTLVILASLTALGFGVYGWIEIRHRPASGV